MVSNRGDGVTDLVDRWRNMASRMAEAEQRGPLSVGQKFLKYAIREQIGRGGHAWVYHGYDPFLDNDVAIKILHRHGGVSQSMLRRGQAEARLLFRLKHPNIVEVQDAGISDDGLLYIVMELLRGKSLRDVLNERGPLPLREALELFIEMTNGVEAAHAFGAIHRDLKPENVFILGDGSCKVLDFGIAKVVDAAGMTTERDVVHGTILYISPEQLEGHKATPRSDLYALGLVFFEALHGRHPLLLNGGNPTVRELSLGQISFRPPRLDELDRNIPRHVARTVEHLLVKAPKERLQSTQELRAALSTSLRRVMEDDVSPRGPFARSVTDRLPLPRDTERIPLSMLPDRSQTISPAASVGTEDLGVPTRTSTAPPMTTPAPAGRSSAWPGEGVLPRPLPARALVIVAAAGLAVALALLLFLFAPPAREAMVDASAARASAPSAVTSAPIEVPAAPPVAVGSPLAAPSVRAAAPPPVVSPPLPSPIRARTLGAASNRTRSPDAAPSRPSADPARQVWIE